MIESAQIVSLGAGSTIPEDRDLSSTFVKIDGKEFLVDAPEGVQQGLWDLELGLGIDAVFVTNSAKRSILGLPGLLNTFSFISDRSKPFTIYCPPGTVHHIREVVDWFPINSFDVNVEEILPGESILTTSDYQINTIDNEHRESYGLKIEEQNVRGEFDREKAEELGVPPGPKYGKLCNGESVEAEDGSIIHPDDVLSEAPNPIKIVFSGRTTPSKQVKRDAQNTTVLIHDAATFEEYRDIPPRPSVSDAAKVASDTNPDIFLLSRLTKQIAHQSDSKIEQRAEEAATIPLDVSVFSYGTKAEITHNSLNVTEVAERG